MSVVAVRLCEDRIEFAADSIVTRGIVNEKIMYPKNIQGKLWSANNMVLGSSGLVNEFSLMHIFSTNHKPAHSTCSDVLKFMNEFYRWADEQAQTFQRMNDYLLGFEGKAFLICDEFLVKEVENFAAIGAGYSFSLTAMHLGKSAKESVEVACELCHYCAPPVRELQL